MSSKDKKNDVAPEANESQGLPAGENGGQEEPERQQQQEVPAEEPKWPMGGKTIRLGRDHKRKTEGEDTPYHKPLTSDDHVNIGMGLQVFFPSKTAQKAGFQPYYLDAGGEPQDATAIVLENFPGVYMPIVEKG